MAQAWNDLAGFNGDAARCSCSDDQLRLVGCDCEAEQNLPIQCDCGAYLRSPEELARRGCDDCYYDGDDCPIPDGPQEMWVGPEFADNVSLEERWEHYAFEERNGMGYGESF